MTEPNAILKIKSGLVYGDITDDFYHHCLHRGSVAVDCETDPCAFSERKYWERSRLHVTSVHAGDYYQVVKHDPEDYDKARRLKRLLEHRSVAKYFHHAMFDLRFLMFHLGAEVVDVECTKLLAKVFGVPAKASLAPLLEFFGLGKKLEIENHSGWAGELTDDHLAYCVADVAHLEELANAIVEWGKQNRLASPYGDDALGSYADLAIALPNVAEAEVLGVRPFSY